jgi:hypothetical protein
MGALTAGLLRQYRVGRAVLAFVGPHRPARRHAM